MVTLDIMVGGSPSSGSTLLSVMLDSHPDILCGPELALFCHPGFWRRDLSIRCPGVRLLYDHLDWYGTTSTRVHEMLSEYGPLEFLERFYGPIAARRGKTLCAEKSPPNVYAMRDYLEAVPHGRCIVTMRDGRDVVCSLMRRGLSFHQALERWVWSSSQAMAVLSDQRVMLIQYADLVTSPRQTLSRLINFLDVGRGLDAMLSRSSDRTDAIASWSRKPADPISAEPVGGWRETLSREQAAEVESSGWMRAFGYR